MILGLDGAGSAREVEEEAMRSFLGTSQAEAR
jgi:hypothetical protein